MKKLFKIVLAGIAHFFIFCSGADPSYLQECPSGEKNKYIGLGGTVFFTSIFATIAMYFALHSIFITGGWYIVPLAFIWGATIFNLDRWVVSTMNKKVGWRGQLGMAIPRILIAGVISLVIAKPLELKIFSDRISYEILEMGGEATKEQSTAIKESFNLEGLANQTDESRTRLAELKRLQNNPPQSAIYTNLVQETKECKATTQRIEQKNSREIASLQATINSIRNNSENYYILDGEKTFLEQSTRERYYNAVSRRDNLKGEIRNQKKSCQQMDKEVLALLKAHQSEYKELINSENSALQNSLTMQDQAQENATKKEEAAAPIIERSFSEGLITQMEALSRLTEKDKGLKSVSIFIMLLFFIIEISPVAVKLMTSKGSYDDYEAFEAKEFGYILQLKTMEAQLMREQDLQLKTSQLDQDLRVQRVQQQIAAFQDYCGEMEKGQKSFLKFFKTWMDRINHITDNDLLDKHMAILQENQELFFQAMHKSKEAFNS